MSAEDDVHAVLRRGLLCILDCGRVCTEGFRKCDVLFSMSILVRSLLCVLVTYIGYTGRTASVEFPETVQQMTYRECVRAIITSQRYSPSGSRSRFDRSIPTSAISRYLKFDGHAETVPIHSLRSMSAIR